MSDRLEEQIKAYLQRGRGVYPSKSVYTYQIIGPVPLDMSGSPSTPSRPILGHAHGRFIDVLSHYVPSLCSFWSDGLPSDDRSGYLEKLSIQEIPQMDTELEARIMKRS